jgi:ABC-type branched-subunit amino acid transport system permease subunit
VFWYFWLGLFMIFVVLFARGGVLGLRERVWRGRRKPP